MKYLCFYICLIFISLSCQPSNSQNHSNFTNDLINESSPYLLQHAHNPVDWKAWNGKALEKAGKESKLILVSIGYAACHWCHVMEEESFQDTAVANLMNQHFVSIKVDREERPDVDDVYMTACQLVSEGGCGWPLNAIALPNGQPVWAGTYYPKKQWVDILNYFIRVYQEDAEKLSTYAAQLTKGVQLSDSIEIGKKSTEFSVDLIDGFSKNFLQTLDLKRGGIQNQIKFPMPTAFEYLLHYNQFSSEPDALKAVEVTLDNMAKGGIYDQLGGGFARYSTDPVWKVPHFEKMLYDNAQLLSLYAKAYQLTKNPLHQQVIEEVNDFLNRELLDASGGYFSSVNADSEGEEGKFYVWKKTEIDALIKDAEEREIINDYFGIRESGNWEEEKNVLIVAKAIAEIAKKAERTQEEVRTVITKGKKTLFEARKKKIAPSLDDKILTAWNALLINGYVDAYRALGDDKYKENAIKIASFLKKEMIKSDFRLDRNYKDGKASINAFLDDYAITIDAFTNLYQVTFEESWLNTADQLTKYALKHFSKPGSPLFFYTSDLDPPLVARKVSVGDNVIPASNSMMAHSLYNLGLLLYNNEYLNQSKEMIANMSTSLENTDSPPYYANWGRLYLKHLQPTFEVVIMGKNAETLRKELMVNYYPNAIFLGAEKESSLKLTEYKYQEGKTMIYVCQNKLCKLPVETSEEAMQLMMR